MRKEDYQKCFDLGKEHLLSDDKMTEEILNSYLYPEKLTTIEGVYKTLLESLRNRGAMGNVIGELDDIENFEQLMCSYDPKEVLKEFNGWRDLFKRVKKKCKPKAKMDIDDNTSYWVHFCKGAIDGAKWMSDLKTYKKFTEHIEKFYNNDYGRDILPMRIASKVHGIGFALASDFLKECGYTKYAKPDVHLKRTFRELCICDSEDDYEIYKAIIDFAHVIDEEPYAVDKLFWMIGSRKLYKTKQKLTVTQAAFITKVKKVIDVHRMQ